TLKAIAKSPSDRYSTAQDMADDLRRYLEDKPIRARRPTLLQRARKFARRHQPVVVAVVSAVFVLLVAALGFLAFHIRQIDDEKKQPDDQRRQAYDLRRQADARADDLRVQLYLRHIALINQRMAAYDLGQVEALLQDCPADLRHWEWGYLN